MTAANSNDKQDLSEEVGMGARQPSKDERDAAAKQEKDEHAKDKAAAAKLPIGRAEPPANPRPVPSPAETEMQAAAGPHRPEPARQVFHDPGAAPAGEAKPPAARGAGLRVRATQDGFYGDARRRAGSVFTIESSKDFSHKWMERVAESTPERSLTGQERIQQEHDAINAGRARGVSTGNKKVLGDDD